MRAGIPALWWVWLMVMCVLAMAFGAAMVFAPHALPLLGPATYNSFFSGQDAYAALTPEESAHHAWILGVLGAVMFGWALNMALIVNNAFRLGRRWAWWALTLGLGLWYVLDTGTSAFHGVWFNVLFNTVFAIPFAIPLAATARDFAPK